MNYKIKKMLLIEIGILLLGFITMAVIKLGLVYKIPPCIIHDKLGILCPSCQGTRCVISFMQGNFYDSFNFHPIFFLLIIYLFIVNIIFIINSFRKKEILTFFYPKLKFWIFFIIIIAIFTICRNVL